MTCGNTVVRSLLPLESRTVNLIIFKVNILYSQLQTFSQSQSGAIQQVCHYPIHS